MFPIMSNVSMPASKNILDVASSNQSETESEAKGISAAMLSSWSSNDIWHWRKFCLRTDFESEVSENLMNKPINRHDLSLRWRDNLRTASAVCWCAIWCPCSTPKKRFALSWTSNKPSATDLKWEKWWWPSRVTKTGSCTFAIFSISLLSKTDLLDWRWLAFGRCVTGK